MSDDKPIDGEVIPPVNRRAEAQRARREREARSKLDSPDEKKAPKPDTEKPKRRSQTKRKTRDEHLAELARSLKGAHDMAAMVMVAGFNLPGITITEQEAAMLAGPLFETCEYYGLDLDDALSPPIQLALVAAWIYFPKFQALRNEILRRRANAAQPTQQEQPPMPEHQYPAAA